MGKSIIKIKMPEDYTLDTVIETVSEIKENYTAKTPRIIKLLDLYIIFCLVVSVFVRLCRVLNPNVSQFANDASFVMAAVSAILTTCLRLQVNTKTAYLKRTTHERLFWEFFLCRLA